MARSTGIALAGARKEKCAGRPGCDDGTELSTLRRCSDDRIIVRREACDINESSARSNIQPGMIIQPAETLLVLCLLAQRPSRPDTELYVPARPTPAAWKSGERTCDSVTAARCESEESSRLAENLNWEIRTLRLSLPLCCRTSNILGRYSVAFVRGVRAKPIYYDCGMQAHVQTLTP
jgi:hypothetical protein